MRQGTGLGGSAADAGMRRQPEVWTAWLRRRLGERAATVTEARTRRNVTTGRELRAADNGGRFGRGAGNIPNHSPVVRRLGCTPCGGARETGCASPDRLGRNLRQGVESRGRSRSGSSLAVPGPPVSRTRGGESGINPQRGMFVPRWADVGPFLRVTIPGA